MNKSSDSKPTRQSTLQSLNNSEATSSSQSKSRRGFLKGTVVASALSVSGMTSTGSAQTLQTNNRLQVLANSYGKIDDIIGVTEWHASDVLKHLSKLDLLEEPTISSLDITRLTTHEEFMSADVGAIVWGIEYRGDATSLIDIKWSSSNKSVRLSVFPDLGTSFATITENNSTVKVTKDGVGAEECCNNQPKLVCIEKCTTSGCICYYAEVQHCTDCCSVWKWYDDPCGTPCSELC